MKTLFPIIKARSSGVSANNLKKWMEADALMKNRYFYEVDLVALLS